LTGDLSNVRWIKNKVKSQNPTMNTHDSVSVLSLSSPQCHNVQVDMELLVKVEVKCHHALGRLHAGSLLSPPRINVCLFVSGLFEGRVHAFWIF